MLLHAVDASLAVPVIAPLAVLGTAGGGEWPVAGAGLASAENVVRIVVELVPIVVELVPIVVEIAPIVIEC